MRNTIEKTSKRRVSNRAAGKFQVEGGAYDLNISNVKSIKCAGSRFVPMVNKLTDNISNWSVDKEFDAVDMDVASFIIGSTKNAKEEREWLNNLVTM